MKLIEAKRLKQAFMNESITAKLFDTALDLSDALRLINNAPTVDAVSVIRCKDCKYYTGKWCAKYSTKQFDLNDICKDDNDFCSMAERKEE